MKTIDALPASPLAPLAELAPALGGGVLIYAGAVLALALFARLAAHWL